MMAHHHWFRIMTLTLSALASVKLFAILAVLFQLLGLMTRNELRLRLLLLLGTFFYIAYYVLVGPAPLWEAVFASTLLALANLYALTFVLLDRSTLWMGAQQRALFRHFPTLNPGQFRRIMQHASWHVLDDDRTICEQGEVPDGLVLLLDGEGVLQRNEKTSKLTPVRFIGEMSFLRGADSGANATVILRAGSRYVMSNRAQLRRKMESDRALGNALLAMFNLELLEKLERSWPE
ncbi:MAG: cyclic nucleotide-binding domain-containing protein [Cyclobacteriaceae bacterium]|nr:cyclic nucleotide-binding domain-containing protein [Cyclobacteriaceae bacterium]